MALYTTTLTLTPQIRKPHLDVKHWTSGKYPKCQFLQTNPISKAVYLNMKDACSQPKIIWDFRIALESYM